MPERFLKQLKNLDKVGPSAEWTANTRRFLVYKVGQETLGKEIPWQEKFAVSFVLFVRKMVPSPYKIGAVALIISMISGMGIVAEASVDPNSSAYALKRIVENVQLALITSPEGQANFNLRLVDKRTAEIIKLAQISDNPQEKEGSIQTVVASLKQNILDAKTSLEVAKDIAPDKEKSDNIVKLAKDITEKSNATIDNLEKVKQATDSKAVGKSVADVQSTIESVSNASLEVLVKGTDKTSDNGSDVVSKDEVKTIITDTIARQVKKIDELNQTAGQVTAGQIKTDDAVKIADQQVDATKLNDVVKQSKVAKEILKQAENLLAQDQLPQALEQVQKSTEITNQSKAVVQKVADVIDKAAANVAATGTKPLIYDKDGKLIIQSIDSKKPATSTLETSTVDILNFNDLQNINNSSFTTTINSSEVKFATQTENVENIEENSLILPQE